MKEAYSKAAVVARALLGFAGGAVLGFFPQLHYLGDGSQEAVSFIGPVVAGLLVGAFAVAIGAPEVRPWFKYLVIGALAGIVIGAVAGVFVWAPLKTEETFGDGTLVPVEFFMLKEKFSADFQRTGVGLGSTMGFVAGLLAGALAWLCMRGEVTIDEDG